jgi:hypothetical protein
MIDTLIWACVALCGIAGAWDILHRAYRVRAVSELEHRIEMAEQNARLALEAAKNAEEYARGVANRGQHNQTRWGRQ